MLRRTFVRIFLFALMVSAFVGGGVILSSMLEKYIIHSFVLVIVGLLIAAVFMFTPCRKCSKLQGFRVFGIIIVAIPIGFCLHCGESYLFDEED